MKKTACQLITALIGSASTAMAATGSDSGGIGFVGICFLSFFALIMVFQLVPGLMLFFSLIKGLFSSGQKTGASVVTEKGGKSF